MVDVVDAQLMCWSRLSPASLQMWSLWWWWWSRKGPRLLRICLPGGRIHLRNPEKERERERKKNVVFRKYVGHAINIYIYTKAYTHHMNILRSNIPVASGNNIPTQYIYAVVHCVECHVMSVQDPSQSSSPLGILNPLWPQTAWI